MTEKVESDPTPGAGVGFRAILQSTLERYNEAITRENLEGAVTQLRILYSNTVTLQDAVFEGSWRALRNGKMRDTLYTRPTPLSARDLDQAHGLFVKLLDRRGMGFLSEATDPLDVEESELLSRIRHNAGDEAEGPEVIVEVTSEVPLV